MKYLEPDEEPTVFAFGAGNTRYDGPLTVKKSEYEAHKKYWEAELERRHKQALFNQLENVLKEIKPYLAPEQK